MLKDLSNNKVFKSNIFTLNLGESLNISEDLQNDSGLLDTIELDIQEIKTNLDEISKAIEALEQKDSTTDETLTQIQQSIENIQQDITNIQEKDEAQDTAIKTIQEAQKTQAEEIADKVGKEDGKGLSANDFTNEYKQKLDNLSNYDDTAIKQAIAGNIGRIATLENENKTIEHDISNMQQEQTNQSKSIEANRSEISELKKEQETQNTKIENLEEKNIEKDSKISFLEAENERLSNDLKNSTLEGQASGESIMLSDSSSARFRSFEISGNTKQEKREGYNFYDGSVSEVNKRVSTATGGTYSCDGFSVSNFIPINGDTTYYIKTKSSSYFCIYDSTKTRIAGGSTSGPINNTPSNASYLKFDFETSDNEVMLTTQKDKPYEQYGAMPSPGFQSPVEGCGDDVNIFDTTILKSQKVNNVTLKVQENGTYRLSGSGTAEFSSDFIVPQSWIGKTLTLSINKIFEGNIGFKNKSTGDILVAKSSTGTKITFEMIEEIANKINKFSIYTNANFSGVLELSFKIQKGSKATAYSKFGQSTASFKVQNKNHLINEIQSQSVNGVTVTRYADGSLLLSGTATSSIKLPFFSGKTLKIPRGQWVLSTKKTGSVNTNAYIDFRDKDNIPLGGASLNIRNSESKKITLDNDFYAVQGYFSGTTGATFNNFLLKIQLEKDTETDYAEHEEQSKVIPVQQKFYDGDKFVKENGMRYEKHTIKEIILDGTQNKLSLFGNFGTDNALLFYYDTTDKMHGNFNVMSNSYTSLAVENVQLMPDGYIRGKADGRRIYIRDDRFASAEEFNTSLAEQYANGTAVKVYYELEEPEMLECTKEQSDILDDIEQNLHTYKNVTHVLSEDEISLKFNATYTKDLETMFNNLATAIVASKEV